MKLAMTNIAVTASVCASASEAALLVASFMPISLDLGVTHRCAKAHTMVDLYSEHPTTIIRFDEPHSANIDNRRIDQQWAAI